MTHFSIGEYDIKNLLTKLNLLLKLKGIRIFPLNPSMLNQDILSFENTAACIYSVIHILQIRKFSREFHFHDSR